jgi:hypothetical protein
VCVLKKKKEKGNKTTSTTSSGCVRIDTKYQTVVGSAVQLQSGQDHNLVSTGAGQLVVVDTTGQHHYMTTGNL